MIELRPIPGGTAFLLGPRHLPRALGGVLVVAGLVMASFMFFWMAGPMGLFEQRTAPEPRPIEVEEGTPPAPTWRPDPAGVAFGLLGLPGLLLGLGLMTAGVLVLARQTRGSVEVDEHEVRVREHAGWLRWTWRTPLSAVRSLSHAVIPGAQKVFTADADDPISFLVLRRAEVADTWCAAGYPLSVLTQLAHHLQREITSHGAGRSVVLQGDPATGCPPGDLEVQEDADGLIIRRKAPALSSGVKIAVVVATLCVLVAWLAAAEFGMGVGMVALFVTLVALMSAGGAVVTGVRAARKPACIRVARGNVEASNLYGAGRFAAAHQARVVEQGSGSDRYRAIALQNTNEASLGEFRWPGNRISEAWIARRIAWALQGNPGDVPPIPFPDSSGVVATAPITPTAPATRAVVEVLLVPHPACRGAIVFGVVFAGFAIGMGTLILFVADEMPWPAIPIVGLFVVVGTTLAWWALRQATRRTAVRMRDGVLEIDQRDWLSHTSVQIPVTEIVAIRTEPTGSSMNDWKFHRLRVVLRDGTRHDAGSQAQPDHLRQVASDLCRSLGLRDDSTSHDG